MSSKLGCALVTGASSGIGADFASELADRGYDLILSARRQDRLEELKEELTARFSIHVEVLVADLGNPAGAQHLFDEIQDLSLPVNLLVNNAGLGRFGAFNSQSLNHGLRSHQIRVCALCPGFFDSEFFDVAGQKLTFMVRMLMLNRRSVARSGIAGVLRGRTLVVPGILYKSLNLLLRLAPRTFTTALADFVVKH